MEQLAHLLLDLGLRPDMGKRATTRLGDVLHEERVRRRTDADREETRPPERPPHFLQHLVLVAHRAIRQEDHLTQAACFSDTLVLQRRLKRRQDFGTAIGLKTRHEPSRHSDVRLVRRHGILEEHVKGVVEADHVERVLGPELGQRLQQGSLRLRHGLARHRAGIVDDEDRLARLALGLNGTGRRCHHGEVVRAITNRFAEEPGLRRALGLQRPVHHEVAVGRHIACKFDHRAAVVGTRYIGVVIERLHRIQRHARLEPDLQRHRIDLAKLRMHHRRRDPRRIGNRARRRAFRGDGQHGRTLPGDVARPHDKGNAQLEFAVVEAHRLLVFDLDDHSLTRPDIGNRVREHVRPLLLDERGLDAGRRGLLVDLAGFGAFLDLAFEEAVAHLHLQRVDCCALRQRIDINSFNPLVRGVLEALRDLRARDEARHLDLDVGLEARRLDVLARLLRAQEQRARPGFVRCHEDSRFGLEAGLAVRQRGAGEQAGGKGGGGNQCAAQQCARALVRGPAGVS